MLGKGNSTNTGIRAGNQGAKAELFSLAGCKGECRDVREKVGGDPIKEGLTFLEKPEKEVQILFCGLWEALEGFQVEDYHIQRYYYEVIV